MKKLRSIIKIRKHFTIHTKFPFLVIVIGAFSSQIRADVNKVVQSLRPHLVSVKVVKIAQEKAKIRSQRLFLRAVEKDPTPSDFDVSKIGTGICLESPPKVGRQQKNTQLVLTSGDLIRDSEKIFIASLGGNQSTGATLKELEPFSGLALLEAGPLDCKNWTIADDAPLPSTGEELLFVGNSLSGIVSVGKATNISAEQLEPDQERLLTAASVDRLLPEELTVGFVLGSKLSVIGLSTSLRINFAKKTTQFLTLSKARKTITAMVNGQKVYRSWIGVWGEFSKMDKSPLHTVKRETASRLPGHSFWVRDIYFMGPFGRAGGQRNDIIIGVDGNPLGSIHQLNEAIKKGMEQNKFVTMLVERYGRRVALDVFPEPAPDPANAPQYFDIL